MRLKIEAGQNYAEVFQKFADFLRDNAKKLNLVNAKDEVNVDFSVQVDKYSSRPLNRNLYFAFDSSEIIDKNLQTYNRAKKICLDYVYDELGFQMLNAKKISDSDEIEHLSKIKYILNKGLFKWDSKIIYKNDGYSIFDIKFLMTIDPECKILTKQLYFYFNGFSYDQPDENKTWLSVTILSDGTYHLFAEHQFEKNGELTKLYESLDRETLNQAKEKIIPQLQAGTFDFDNIDDEIVTAFGNVEICKLWAKGYLTGYNDKKNMQAKILKNPSLTFDELSFYERNNFHDKTAFENFKKVTLGIWE